MAGLYPFGVYSFMATSLPIARRIAKCVVDGEIVPRYSLLYQFDEGSGQVLTDYSGNGYHGKLGSTAGDDTADPAWSTAGLAFDGDDYVAIPTFPAPTATISIVFFTATDIGPASTAQFLFGGTISGDSTGGIALGAGTASLTDEIVAVHAGPAGGRAGWCDAGGSIAAGWHLLTCAWDGAAWAIVLDGSVKTVTTANAQVGITTTESCRLGSRGDGLSKFTGEIAHVIAYPFALSTNLIAHNHAALKAILAPCGVTLP